MASLIHTHKEELPEIIQNLVNGLIPGGVLFVCFTNGQIETTSALKILYNEYTEDELKRIFDSIPGLHIIKQETVIDDAYPDRPQVQFFVKKTLQSSSH